MSQWLYQTPQELSDEQYARWRSLLESRTGISFFKHKSILQKGLSQRMREVGARDYEQYFKQVSRIPEGAIEWTQLVDRISVKETSFFRDNYSYNAVREYLLDILQERSDDPAYMLDLWSVGCSSGEEAYSLAITATDVIDELGVNVFLGVTATDISQTALTVARKGIYSLRKLENMPEDLQGKYFQQMGNANIYQVDSSLRSRICFVNGNVLELDKIPKMTVDVIYCQNVLIYFHRDRQHAVLNHLVEHLNIGGLLVVGPVEAMGWKNSKVRRQSLDNVQAYIKC